MPPNERGACPECMTLDFECICDEPAPRKRKAEELVSGDSSSDVDYEDVVHAAMEQNEQFGVSWQLFSQRREKDAFEKAVRLAQQVETQSCYVGVAKCPNHRFFEPPSPHKMRFDVLYPLLVGKRMGGTEKKLISALLRAAPEKLTNQSRGGEGISPLSIRFLYLCVRRVRPSSSGFMYVTLRVSYIHIYTYIYISLSLSLSLSLSFSLSLFIS